MDEQRTALKERIMTSESETQASQHVASQMVVSQSETNGRYGSMNRADSAVAGTVLLTQRVALG